jgi:hypothetical protein
MLFTKAIGSLPIENFSRLRRIPKDDGTGELFNIGIDVEISIPPIFSRFRVGQIPLRMAICEIYLHMTYHKDRANPTHDERRILEKILKCQYKYEAANLGQEIFGRLGDDDLSYAKHVLSDASSDFTFSARAVNIGSKLQRLQIQHRAKEMDPFVPLRDHGRGSHDPYGMSCGGRSRILPSGEVFAQLGTD